MCSESGDINWVSREGASTAKSPSDSAHAGCSHCRVCGRTLPQHSGESLHNDLMIVTGCLQHQAYKMVTSLASLFDKPTQPDVLLRSLSNWCKVWRSESCIFHPAYCVLSFDMGSRFTFASDYRSALIKREPALPQNE